MGTPVEEHLRAAILEGHLGVSERLVEADLCERYQASRHRVREALDELEREGLVERRAHSGARVRVLSASEVVEILEVRVVLEPEAAARAAARATSVQLAVLEALVCDMEAALAVGALVPYERLSARLHLTVTELAGNRVAVRVTDRLIGLSAGARVRSAARSGGGGGSVEAYRAIVRAIGAGDAPGARLAMRTHLQAVLDAMSTSR